VKTGLGATRQAIFSSFQSSHERVELLYKTLGKLSKKRYQPINSNLWENHDLAVSFIEAPDHLVWEFEYFFYSRAGSDNSSSWKNADSADRNHASESDSWNSTFQKLNFRSEFVFWPPYAQ